MATLTTGKSMTALLAELRELLEASTPGPWRELYTRIDDASGYQLCHLDLHGKTERERDANRRLIVAMRNSLAALLDRVEAAELDARRWRHFRDEMDMTDALHMIASGTAHYDTAIDAALKET